MLGPGEMDARTAESPVISQQQSWLQRERASGRFYDRAAVLIGFVLLGMLGLSAIVFFINRRRWGRRAKAIPGMSSDSAQRLERLENGMEAIAIEIERISEGQRFVTKLLSQSDPAAQAAVDSVKPLAIEKQSIKV